MVYWADLIIFFLSYLIPSARFLITLWIHWTYVYRRSRTNWYILYCSDCLDLIRAIIHYSAIKCPFEYVRTAMITSSYRKWWTFSNDSSEAQNEQKRRTKKKQSLSKWQEKDRENPKEKCSGHIMRYNGRLSEHHQSI